MGILKRLRFLIVCVIAGALAGLALRRLHVDVSGKWVRTVVFGCGLVCGINAVETLAPLTLDKIRNYNLRLWHVLALIAMWGWLLWSIAICALRLLAEARP